MGDYKKKANMIGDQQTVAPLQVKGEMAKLLIDYNQNPKVTFEDIIEFHYNIECIHPFQDGNGRVGRMIIFKECLKNGREPLIDKSILSGKLWLTIITSIVSIET